VSEESQSSTESSIEEFDADRRELCPDGNCTGVLDDDGVCKVCGARGTPPLSRPARAEDAVADALGAAEATGAAEVVAAVVPSAAGSEDFDDRRLCPDGDCIGLLGADGRCKVCGRSAS
jgi:hypothetical protein